MEPLRLAPLLAAAVDPCRTCFTVCTNWSGEKGFGSIAASWSQSVLKGTVPDAKMTGSVLCAECNFSISSTPDSLGIYVTWQPRIGRTDAERNCVSNVRPAGQPIAQAAARTAWLLNAARRRALTGVQLKDDSERPLLT